MRYTRRWYTAFTRATLELNVAVELVARLGLRCDGQRGRQHGDDVLLARTPQRESALRVQVRVLLRAVRVQQQVAELDC